MNGVDFDLYKLRFDQMDAVRAAHRDSRRFHITLNVTGVSTMLGLYGQFGLPGLGMIGAASFGLMLMCLVWWVTTAYAAKNTAIKAKSVLELEERLGLSYFRDDLQILHGSPRVPGFAFDRGAALLLGLAYATIACGALVRAGIVADLIGLMAPRI